LAVINGHEAIVQLLLATKGVNPNLPDTYGWSPLAFAAAKGQTSIVAHLLAAKGINPNARDSLGRTPLMEAARWSKDTEVVRLLLDAEGVDVGASDRDGCTALIWTCRSLSAQTMEGEWTEFFRLVNIFPPFIGARHHNRPRTHILELLLDADKAGIGAADNDGRTPLMWAVMARSMEAIQLLLAADFQGAGLERADTANDFTPFLWAIHVDFVVAVKSLLPATTEGVKRILWKGSGLTELGYLKRKNLGLVAELIEAKAIDDAELHEEVVRLLILSLIGRLEEEEGELLMHLAVHRGSMVAIELLVSHQMLDPNARDRVGRTPLMKAAGMGYKALVQVLLQKGADVESLDDKGRLPLWYAMDRKFRLQLHESLIADWGGSERLRGAIKEMDGIIELL